MSADNRSNLTPHEIEDLILYMSQGVAEGELRDEKDQSTALRKALLVLIALTQHDSHDAASCFIHFLLTDFQPLNEHFEDHSHPYLLGHDVRRGTGDHIVSARDARPGTGDGDKVHLLFSESFIEKLLSEIQGN